MLYLGACSNVFATVNLSRKYAAENCVGDATSCAVYALVSAASAAEPNAIATPYGHPEAWWCFDDTRRGSHNILGHVRVVRSGLRSEAWPMAMQADMDILVMTPQCTSRLELIEASL